MIRLDVLPGITIAEWCDIISQICQHRRGYDDDDVALENRAIAHFKRQERP
jgi:hypothetical protein